ncbi:hypothetical protein L1049_008680 [Liquidambar formosana]|uniref:Protein cornichon homolog 1 n=1 Tax=Liquidambar formosana TaxID=63359 RepID=A0AAP0SA15_LIQFO
MAWELILWFIFFIINIALLALNLYQIICLSDLESDYLNPYELASRINAVVLPEFILQGVFSVLFLLKGHWFMFLLTVPITYYHTMLYMNRKHLIDVTEVFSVLSSQKKYRIIKLGFYLFFFTIVIVRIFAAGILFFNRSEFGELDIRSSVLEF